MDKESILQTSFEETNNLYNKKIEPTTAPPLQIGIDLNNELLSELVDSAQSSYIDLSKIQSFTTASRNRNELYDTLDYMAEDTTLSSVLETYAEDATEMNDAGEIIWCEADDSNISKYMMLYLRV